MVLSFTYIANGDGQWAEGRRPPHKKLKVTVPKTARSRGLNVGHSATSKTSSTLREEPSSESSSESEPDDDSDYESDSEEELEVEEVSPLSATRPAEPSKAVEFDIIKAVWAPRASPPTPAAIRTALGDYWNVVKAVRDAWKADTASLQQAEEDKLVRKIPELKNKVVEQRTLMEAALTKTLEHGHKDIIEKYVGFFFFFLGVHDLSMSCVGESVGLSGHIDGTVNAVVTQNAKKTTCSKMPHALSIGKLGDDMPTKRSSKAIKGCPSFRGACHSGGCSGTLLARNLPC